MELPGETLADLSGNIKTPSEKQFNVLITGANSGLGLATCYRLIDEFLYTRPSTEKLTLILTTRDNRKGDATVARIQKHLAKLSNGQYPGAADRVRCQPEILDLTDLLSVQRLSKKLLKQLLKIDALILNAGYGGWTGIDIWGTIWEFVTDFQQALAWPKSKLSSTGTLVKTALRRRDVQIQGEQKLDDSNEDRELPPLGEIFCANVFGHYLLSHSLAPLLRGTAASSRTGEKGRVIWLSSLESEAVVDEFTTDDIQGLKTPHAYEVVKRLCDILVLTSHLPSTKPWVRSFFTPFTTTYYDIHQKSSIDRDAAEEPRMYVTHPGICATDIMPLHWMLAFLKIAAFYLARWLGSPWHTIDPYMAAVGPVWLALSPQAQLDSIEKEEGAGKWGSATDLWGDERVRRTEVAGWGFRGVVGEEILKRGRIRSAKPLTKESREGFEELGRQCWRQMEGLREEWEARLEGLD